MDKKTQIELLAMTSNRAININEVTLGGTAIHLTKGEFGETDYFEFNILYHRPGSRVESAAEIVPQESVVDKIRVVVKDGEAAEYLDRHLEEQDAIFIRGWIDTMYSKPVVVLDSKSNILYHKHFCDETE